MEFITQEQSKEINEKKSLYGFITNEGPNLSKTDLITFFKEYNYAVYEIEKEIDNEVIEKMKEHIEDGELDFMTEDKFDEIKETGLFDFLSNEGYSYKQDELIALFKEYNYAVYDINKELDKQAIEILLEKIEDSRNDD